MLQDLAYMSGSEKKKADRQGLVLKQRIDGTSCVIEDISKFERLFSRWKCGCVAVLQHF